MTIDNRLPGVNGRPKHLIRVSPEARERARIRKLDRETEEQGYIDIPLSPPQPDYDSNPDFDCGLACMRLLAELCHEYEDAVGHEYRDDDPRGCPKDQQWRRRELRALSQYGGGQPSPEVLQILRKYHGNDLTDEESDPARRRVIALPLELIYICQSDLAMALVLAQIRYWYSDGIRGPRNAGLPLNKTHRHLSRETGVPDYTVKRALQRLVNLGVISVGTIRDRPAGNNWGSQITLHQDRLKELVRQLPQETRDYCRGRSAKKPSR